MSESENQHTLVVEGVTIEITVDDDTRRALSESKIVSRVGDEIAEATAGSVILAYPTSGYTAEYADR